MPATMTRVTAGPEPGQTADARLRSAAAHITAGQRIAEVRCRTAAGMDFLGQAVALTVELAAPVGMAVSVEMAGIEPATATLAGAPATLAVTPAGRLRHHLPRPAVPWCSRYGRVNYPACTRGFPGRSIRPEVNENRPGRAFSWAAAGECLLALTRQPLRRPGQPKAAAPDSCIRVASAPGERSYIHGKPMPETGQLYLPGHSVLPVPGRSRPHWRSVKAAKRPACGFAVAGGVGAPCLLLRSVTGWRPGWESRCVISDRWRANTVPGGSWRSCAVPGGTPHGLRDRRGF